MPSRTGWIVDNMVVYAQTKGHIDNEAFLQADKRLYQYIEESDQELVHFIFDYTEVTRLPQITVQSQATIAKHPRFGWAVVFGSENRLLRFLTSVSAQLFQLRFRMVDTFTEAEAHLRHVYPNLPEFKTFDEIDWHYQDWDEPVGSTPSKV